jgi:hypothetical protein
LRWVRVLCILWFFLGLLAGASKAQDIEPSQELAQAQDLADELAEDQDIDPAHAQDKALDEQPEREKFLLDLGTARPTQPDIGQREVDFRKPRIVKKFRRLKTKARRRDWLWYHSVPVIIGPRGVNYIVDRHHLCRALLELGYNKTYGEVLHDWSKLPEEKFWENMRFYEPEGRGYLHLKDQHGNMIEPKNLPKTLMKMGDNLYRSLVYFVKRAGGFEKMPIPFFEFDWADFFNKFIPYEILKSNWDKALEFALKLCHSEHAMHQSGFSPFNLKQIKTCAKAHRK